jgi:peptidyl-prolyl cis-trans isomerase C
MPSLSKFRLSFLLPVAMLATAALAQTPAPLVTGEHGVAVTRDDIAAAALRIPDASRQAAMSRVNNISRQAEEIYIRRALAVDAERAGLDKDPVVQALLRQARERILSDAQIKALEQTAKLSDDTVRAYARDVYRSNPRRFETPAQTRARHILIARTPDGKAEEKAAEILARAKKGENFEELARQHSADYATAARGGDLGFFAAGQMVKSFEDAVARLTQPGQISDIVETEFGYHIVKLEARREAGMRTFDEVRESLEREVRAKAAQEARQARIDVIQRAAKVDAAAMEALAAEYGRTKP